MPLPAVAAFKEILNRSSGIGSEHATRTRVRDQVSVGLINPGVKPLAGKLRGDESDGVGGHWWEKLSAAAYTAHQLPDPVGRLGKPYGW